jgi:hypothetical protein
MLSPSVGYFIKRASDVILNKQAKLRRVKRAFLDHLSFVESPAFKQGAEVLAVREELRPPAELEPLPSTPILDELFEDEVLAWARTRLGQ